MNFYFCESCNKRITDADLAAGSGKDKKVKGVFCKDCAAGVNTMEFEALSDSAAREVIAQTSAHASTSQALHPVSKRAAVGSERPSSRVARAISNAGESGRGAERAVPKSGTADQSKWILIAAVGGGGLGLIVLVILFSGGNATPPLSAKASEPPKINARTESDRTFGEAPATSKVIPPTPAISPTALVEKPAARDDKAAPSADDLPAKAFDAALKKIGALGDDKLGERKSVAEAFVKEYPDSMEAARMRVKIREWSAPKPPPAPAVVAQPAPAAEGADSASRTDDKETRILFTCTSATDEGSKPFNNGQRELAEVFGVKSMAWMADKIKDPPWHSTGMSIDISQHTTTPVKITPNTWVRFACRLEGGTNLMMHCGIGDTIYEIHQANLPEKKWFWASFKASDFSRNFHGGDPKPKAGLEYKFVAIFAGANKVPCTLYVEKFTIGEGPIPKE